MRIVNAIDPAVPFSSLVEPVGLDALESLRERRLLELIHRLEAQGTTPAVHAIFVTPEMWLLDSKAIVKVWADWMDCGPLSNGFPNTHYRIVIKPRDAPIRELRIMSVDDASQTIVNTFRTASDV